MFICKYVTVQKCYYFSGEMQCLVMRNYHRVCSDKDKDKDEERLCIYIKFLQLLLSTYAINMAYAPLTLRVVALQITILLQKKKKTTDQKISTSKDDN